MSDVFCHSQPDYPQHGLHQWPDNYRWMYPPGGTQ